MPTTETQTAAVVGMLTAATGTEPTIDHAPGCVRIEAPLPADLGAAQRQAVLLALAQCDRYGHTHTADGATVWAELDKEA